MEPDELAADVLNPLEEYPPTWAYMDAADVVREVLERDAGAVFRLRRRPSMAPVLTISDRYLVGPLDLRAVEFPYLLEFVRCRFQQPPDLRQAKLAGITFNRCWLPGLEARNLSSDNDLMLVEGTVVDGMVDLTDSNIQGSLVLLDCTLNMPDGIALHACRLTLAGAVSAARLHAVGEVRISGLRAGGNVRFSGARLTNRKGFALDGNGMQVGGNMHLHEDPTGGRFESVGRLFLPSARIDGDFSLRGAVLEPPPDEASPDPVDERFFDPEATLIADRVHVAGNVDVDQGFRSTGTLRIVNAYIGGTLRLTRATVDMSGGAEPFEERAGGAAPGPYPHRALHLDGTEIRGGIDARDARIAGQVRVVDVVAQGSVLLDGAVVSNRNGDAVEGRRFTTGGNLDARGITLFGSILLPGAKIGSNLDLGGSRLISPGHYRDGNPKPAVDLRVAQIGRDLICADRSGRPFSSQGEIRMRRAEIGRETNFRGAELSSRGTEWAALNAFGLITQELRLDVGVAPRGRISLRHARCASFADNEKFWAAEGDIDLDDFRYDAFIRPIKLEDDAQIRQRLKWMRRSMGDFRPGPYDQFAAMLRASGNEEHASTVLIAKQRWRYVALSQGYRVLGPLVRVWSWLQRWMVGYGYRPMRALLWLIACLAFGTTWFAAQPTPAPVSVDDVNLVWNAPLYTLDLVIPIIDFGQKNKWEFIGVSQWISTGLVAAGWILATTVAAGVTRMLRRTSA